MRQSTISRQHPTGKALSRELIFTKTRNDNLFSIKNLNLWGNDLEDLSLLQQMPNLQVISLSVNNIKTLKNFRNCHKLQQLYLRKNEIKTLQEIEYLVDLPQLRILWLFQNPCASSQNYRQIVISQLSSLTKLDNDVITEGERQRCIGNNNSMVGDNSGGRGKQQAVEEGLVYYQARKNNYIESGQNLNSSQKYTQHQLSKPQVQKNTPQQRLSFESPMANKNRKSLSYETQNPSLMKNYESNIQHSGNKNMPKNADRVYMEESYEEKMFRQNFSSMNIGNNDVRRNVDGRIEREGTAMENKSQVNKAPRPMTESSTHNQHPYNKQIPTSQPHYQPSHNQYYQQPSSTKNTQQPHNPYIVQPQINQHTKPISSPNVIMAIMSLLDDLNQDGLQLIKRQVQRKLQQSIYDTNDRLRSDGKGQKLKAVIKSERLFLVAYFCLINLLVISTLSNRDYFSQFSFSITVTLLAFDDDLSKCFKSQNIHTITLTNSKKKKKLSRFSKQMNSSVFASSSNSS